MKTISLFLTISLAFASCDFGSNETATTPPVTEPQDTNLPTRVDNTAVETPLEVPVAELPKDSEKQELASQGVSITTAPGMKVEDLETFILVCSNEVVKDAKCFTLERYNKQPAINGHTSITLKGRHFVYSEKAAGNNKDLEGYLQLGSQWYLVKATDKYPTWIFPYLAHVELSNKAQ